jgi:hypothetical protein
VAKKEPSDDVSIGKFDILATYRIGKVDLSMQFSQDFFSPD